MFSESKQMVDKRCLYLKKFNVTNNFVDIRNFMGG